MRGTSTAAHVLRALIAAWLQASAASIAPRKLLDAAYDSAGAQCDVVASSPAELISQLDTRRAQASTHVCLRGPRCVKTSLT
jgi:hypothetical protein